MVVLSEYTGHTNKDTAEVLPGCHRSDVSRTSCWKTKRIATSARGYTRYIAKCQLISFLAIANNYFVGMKTSF